MAKAMAPYGGVYITHMRSEADQFLEIEIRRGQLSEFVNAAVRDK